MYKENIKATLGIYGHLYPNSNFEIAKKIKGTINYKPSHENLDTSPRNQYTKKFIRQEL